MSIAIIGSGYGGAVAAHRLTQAGHSVTLIEMGQDWDKTASVGNVFAKMTNPDGRSFWFESRTDLPYTKLFGLDIVNRAIPSKAGALAVERFAEMKVYAGRGLGGGSLVNGGMAVTPRQSFFSQVLPHVDSDEMFSTYFPRARTNLKVAAPPQDIIAYSPFYKFSRTAAGQNAAAGYSTVDVPNVYDWDYMRQESFKRVTASATAQEVIYGNNYGKNSLTRSYLAAALATGNVTVTPMTEVTRIRRDGSGRFVLTLKTITWDGIVLATVEQSFDRVVLAAGSVGTARLLLSAKAAGDLPDLNNEVGKRWGPNGNTMVLRSISAEVGAYQSGMPAQGLDAWDDTPTAVFAEIAPLPIGLETKTAGYLAITNNPNEGEYGLDADGKLTLSWNAAMHAPSVAATKTVIDRLNAVNGGSTVDNMLEDGKQYSDYFTYHPLGGAVLGEATDNNGELLGEAGLFVLDGSLIPAKIGVNPFVTITALAERNMDRLIAAGRFA